MGRMSKMLSEFKGSFNDDSCTLITNPELLTNIDLEKHYDYELDEILNEQLMLTMAISNCLFSPTSENSCGFSVWCVLAKVKCLNTQLLIAETVVSN